jgi:hypothetical protein
VRLVRDWSVSAGQERDSRGRSCELVRKPVLAVNRLSERRLTRESPGQAPFFVSLEEAQLLRRVRHEKVLRLLVVQRL